MFVLFQPDLENCKSKGVETCPCLPFFHTKHCWPSFMYYVRKICIHYANFHDCNFFGKHCELLWRQTFFSLEALSLGIILIDCFFSCVHCLWIINKIVMTIAIPGIVCGQQRVKEKKHFSLLDKACQTRFSRHCIGFEGRRFSLIVGYNQN